MNIGTIKLESQIVGINQAIRARQAILVNIWHDTYRDGRFFKLGTKIREAQTILSEINELLKALQHLDHKVT